MPKAIKESIKHLKSVFESISARFGKDPTQIFAESVNKDGEIPIKVFVERLFMLDPTIDKDTLYRTCR